MEPWDSTQTYVNGSETSSPVGTGSTQPRSLSDLRSFLDGYRIKAGTNTPNGTMANIIVASIDCGRMSASTQRAARELAELDPSLSWLPGWKPRVAIQALRKGDS